MVTQQLGVKIPAILEGENAQSSFRSFKNTLHFLIRMWITQAYRVCKNYLSLHMEWIKYRKLTLFRLRSDYL